jgi:hypothetical protein
MPLRVAACPRCKGALVFGEKACRSCGQTFQYGANAPPTPTFQQIVEALAAAGLPLPPGATPTPPTRTENANPFDNAIESGRFKPTGQVMTEEIPGFIDSSLFAAFTPDHVDVTPVFGLETGRSAEVGEVAVAFTPGVEHTAKDAVGEVFTEPVSGIFHSDIFAFRGDVVTTNVDGFEPSPSATPPPKAKAQQAATTTATGKKKKQEFARSMCSCGEIHNLDRCPACGRPHKDSGL